MTARLKNEIEAFEAALGQPSPEEHYVLRLFITGKTPRSSRAIQNIRNICEEKLQGRYELEIIDIYQHPERIAPEQLCVTPTLIKELPLPVRRMIGDLSDKHRVLVALDVIPKGSAPSASGLHDGD